MPVEEGYNARIMPQAGSAMPLATPETYGAGLFKAVGEAGDTLNQISLWAYQQERRLTADREAADFAHRFALHRQNMDGVVEQLRTNPTSPDYAEHVKLVQQADQAARDSLLAGITEDSVRNRALEQLDAYGAQLHDSELTYAEGQRIAKVATDSQTVSDIGANRIRQGMDPQHYGQEVKAWHDYVGGLNNITPTVRDKLLREGDQKYAVSYINHLNDTNPNAALALIDAGAFNEVLTPEQIDAARNGSQVEIRRAEAAAQREQAVAKAAFHESVATIKAQDAQGIDVSGQLPQLIQQAGAYGDTSTVVELQGIARSSAFAKVWNVATPIQRQRRLAELQAIPEAKRTQDQQAELKWHLEKDGPLDAKFAADPVGFVIQNGKPGEQPPALDWTNPQSIQARAQWVRTMVGAYGSMSPLSKVEVQQVQANLNSGPAGIKSVAAALSMFGGVTARAAARQVAPDDTYLQHVVTLPPALQRMAIEGRAARKADPKLLPQNDPNLKDKFAETATSLHQALASLAISDREGIISAARDIAAYHIREEGAPVAPGTFYRAMNEALGSVGPEGQRKGGLGSWQGHSFLVPDSMTAQEFTNRAFKLIAQHPEKAPTNPDGSKFDLKAAYPVRTQNGGYRFFVGDRVVTQNGQPWIYYPEGRR